MGERETPESIRKLARAVVLGDITAQQFSERMRGLTPEELDQLAHELRVIAARADSSRRHRDKRSA